MTNRPNLSEEEKEHYNKVAMDMIYRENQNLNAIILKILDARTRGQALIPNDIYESIIEHLNNDGANEIAELQTEVERLQGQLTRAVSIAGVLLADIEDYHEGDPDDEWTRNGWNDSRISKSLLQQLIEEMTNNSTNTKNTQKDDK
jgi:hypothetical protein